MSAADAIRTISGGVDPEKELLPPLRQDIELLAAPRSNNGAPAWTLHDPVRNAFFRIGAQEFEMLSHWQLGSCEAISRQISNNTAFQVSPQRIAHFLAFLRRRQLVKQTTGCRPMAQKATAALRTVLFSYLYLRIPLCNPDRFLSATVSWISFCFSPLFWFFIIACGLSGLYLVSRQWDVFLQTFLYFFNLQGVLYYCIALVVAKGCHELAHGYAAKYHGLRVPTMGLAFIVLWPVLYSDTTEAWKLTSRRQRLVIGAAGILAEIALGAVALLFWNFLPPGPLRSGCFLLATTTWLISLTVNLNPLLRFDGYYLLADYLDIPNLQSRALAMSRWFSRKILFGTKEPKPEIVPPRTAKTLLSYGFLSRLYRFVIFISIALFIYHLVFKALGLLLLGGQMLTFFGIPMLRGLSGLKNNTLPENYRLTTLRLLFLLVILLGLFLYPFKQHIEIPALYKPSERAAVYPPRAARIEEILTQPGRKVRKGEILFTLHSPGLDYLALQTAGRKALYAKQLLRMPFISEYADQTKIVEKQLTQATTRHEGILQEQRQLRITAPFSGIIAEMDETLMEGQWVGKSQQLALLINNSAGVMEGFVKERHVQSLNTDTVGRFYPDIPELPALPCIVQSISPTHEAILREPAVASVYGGDLAVRYGENGELLSQETYYKVILHPDTRSFPQRIITGKVRLELPAANIIQRIWKPIAVVMLRESAF